MNKQKRETQRRSGCLHLVSDAIGKALALIGGLSIFALIILGIIVLTQPRGTTVPAPLPSAAVGFLSGDSATNMAYLRNPILGDGQRHFG